MVGKKLIIIKILVIFSLTLLLNSCSTAYNSSPSFTSNNNDFIKEFSRFKTIEGIHNYFDSTDSLDIIEGIWDEAHRRVWYMPASKGLSFAEQYNNSKYAIIRNENCPFDFQHIFISSNTCVTCEFGSIAKGFTITKISENKYYIKNIIQDWKVIIEIKNGNYFFWEYEYLSEKRTWWSFKYDYEKLYPYENKSRPDRLTSYGTGFFYSSGGLIVTNSHVVEDADTILIKSSQLEENYYASVIQNDTNNDIAILQILNNNVFNLFENIEHPIRLSDKVKVGQEVFTIGYPLGNILGNENRASFGRINSLYGIEDDPRLMQISNPLSPGNSGGPLLNLNGELVGIVVSGLNAKYFYENLGIIPQNVNFAIKIDYLKPLLNNIDPVLTQKNSTVENLPTKVEDQIDYFKPFIVQIIAKR